MVRASKTKLIIVTALAVILTGFYVARRIFKKAPETWITVLVHGSVTPMLKPPSIGLIIKLFQDKLEGTLYQRVTQLVRHNPYFTKDQPMQEIGLKKIGIANTPASFFAHAFDLVSQWTTGPKQNLCYTYGWSGTVGIKLRYQDTLQFYKVLAQEVEQLRTQGIDPKIRIMGFSHGGSICLDLAKVLHQEKFPQTFYVDELMLIGTPLNRKMNPQLYSPLFKKIYNLYSLSDGSQCLDLLAPGSIFSKRVFTSRKKIGRKKSKPLPDNLQQVEIKIMTPKEEQPLDATNQFDDPMVLAGSPKLFNNMSPYHLEPWFFAWTDRGYRKNFPFYPLPLSTIIPAITNAADKYGDRHCVVDIRPDDNKIIVHNNQQYSVADLFPQKENLATLRTVVPKSCIVQRTSKQYWKIVNRCIRQAKQKKGQAAVLPA